MQELLPLRFRARPAAVSDAALLQRAHQMLTLGPTLEPPCLKLDIWLLLLVTGEA